MAAGAAELVTENNRARPTPVWSVKDEPGVAFTPGGSPWRVTLTEPLNPFCGTTEAVTVEAVFPITAAAEIGVTDRLKSRIAGVCQRWLPTTRSSTAHVTRLHRHRT